MSTAPTTTAPSAPAGKAQKLALYVGDLAADVNEAKLFEIFNQIGPVESIRVIRDNTLRSLGYAYVNYRSSNDAEAALEQLNFTPINGRMCRVSWSERDPSGRRSTVGNLFIKNLEESIDSKALMDVMSEFGSIKSIKIVYDEVNKSKGYGFTQFETEEQAEKAMASLNGKLMNGKKVTIGKFIPKKERMAQSQAQYTNVFVKNLAEDVTEDVLTNEFLAGQYGTIQSIVVMRDKDNKSKGFGFINFDTHENAQRAVEEMNNKELHGKAVFVGRAMKKSERLQFLKEQYEQRRQERISKFQGVNVYIKNLLPEFDDDLLRKEFSRFGTISSARVMRDEKGASRLFGFVCFSTPEEALNAVREMNGHMLMGKPLYCAIAQSKEQRRRLLEQQFAQRQARAMPPMAGGMPYAMAGYYGGMPQGRQAAGYGMPYGGQPMMMQGGRGMPNRWGQQPMMMMPQQAPVQPAQPQSREAERNMLGEKLFPLVNAKNAANAGKITGMLLELDANEVRRLISEPALLDSKIKEALEVLEKAAKPAAPRQ